MIFMLEKPRRLWYTYTIILCGGGAMRNDETRGGFSLLLFDVRVRGFRGRSARL
jgi:hypothetical protein